MSDFDDFVQYQGDGSESRTVGNAGGSLSYRQSPGFAMPLHGGSVTAAAPGSLLSGVGAYSIGGVAAPFLPPSAVGHTFPTHSMPPHVVAVATAMPAARQLAGASSGNFHRLAGDVLPGPGAGAGAGRSVAATVVLAPEGILSRHASETTSASVVHDKSDGRPKFTKEDFARKHRTSDALSQIDAFKVTAKKDVEHKAGQRMPTQSLSDLSDASSGTYGFGATGVQPLTYQAPALSAVAGLSIVAHDGIAQQSLHPVAMPAVWTMASPQGGMAVLQLQQDHQYQQQQQQQQYTAAAAAATAEQGNRHSEHATLPYMHYSQTAHVGHFARGPLSGTPHVVNAGDLHSVNASFSSPNSGTLPTSLTASSTGMFDAFANSSYHVNSALASPASGAPVELASSALAASSGIRTGGARVALGNAPVESKVQSSIVTADSLVRAPGNLNFFSAGMDAIGVENRPVAPVSLDDFDDFISYGSPMGPASNLQSSAANYAGASATHSQLTQASAAFPAHSQSAIRHATSADAESVLASTIMPPVPISDVNRAGRSIPGDNGISVRDLHKPTKIRHDAPMQKVEVIFKRYVDSDPTRPLPLSGDSTGPSVGKINRLNKSPPAVHRDQHIGFVSTKVNHHNISHPSAFAADVVNSADADADFGDFQFLPADTAATAAPVRMTAVPSLPPVVGYPAGDDALHNGLHADAQLSGLASPISSSLPATAAVLVSPWHSSSLDGQPVAKTLNSTSSVATGWQTVSGKTPFEATIPHQNQIRPQPQHGQLPPLQQSSANFSETENASDEFIAFQSFLPSSDQRAHVSSSESLPTNGSQLPHHVVTAHVAAAEAVAHPKQSSKAANWMAMSDLSEFVESEGTAKSTDLMGESSVFDSVPPRVAKFDTRSNDWSMSHAAADTSAGDEPDEFADFAAFQKVEVGSRLTDSTSWHASAAAAPVLPPVSASNASGLPFAPPDSDDGDWGSFLGPSNNVLPAAVTAPASVGHAASALTGYDGLFGDGSSHAHGVGESNVVMHQRNEANAVGLAAILPNSVGVGSLHERGSNVRTSDRDFEAAHVHSSRVSSHRAANNPVTTATSTGAASVASPRGRQVGGDVFDDDNGYDPMQPPPLDDYEHDFDGDGSEASRGANVEEEEEVYDIAFGGFASYVGAVAQSGADPRVRQHNMAAQELAVRSATAGADTVRDTKQHEADSVDPVGAARKRSADRDEIAQANASVVDVGESAAAAITQIISPNHVQTAVDNAGGLDRIDEKIGGRFSLNHATFGDALFVMPSSQQSAASECAVDEEFAEFSAVRETDIARTGGCSSGAGDGGSSNGGTCAVAATTVTPGVDALSGRSIASGVSLASSMADTSGRQNDFAAYDDDSSSESWGFAASPPPLPPADPSDDADDDDNWGLTAQAARDRSVSPASSAEPDSMSGWAEFRATAPGLSDPAAATVPVADSPFGTSDRSYTREPPALAGIGESSSDGGWDDLHSAVTTVEPPADDSRDFAAFFTSSTAAASVAGGGGTVAPPATGQLVGDRVEWLSAADDASSSTGWASEWAAAAASHATVCSEPEQLPAATGLPPPLAMKLPTVEPPEFDSDDDGGDDWEFSAARLPTGGESVANRKSPETPAKSSEVQHVHAVDNADDDEEWSFGQPVPTVTSSPGDDDWAFQRSGSPVGSAAATAADASVAVSSTGAGTAARSTVKELPMSIPQSATLKVLHIAFAASAVVQWASLAVAASGLPRTVGSSLKACRLWTRLCDLDSSPAMTDMVWSSSTGCRRMLDTLPLAEVSLGRQTSSAGECSPFGTANRSESRAGLLMPVSLAPTRTAGRSSSNAGARAKEATIAAAATAASAAGGSSSGSAPSSTLDAVQPQRHQRSSDAKINLPVSSSDSDWMFADPVPPDLTTGTASTAASLMPATAAQFDLDFLESLSSTTSRPSAAADSGSARQPSLPLDLDLSFFEARAAETGRKAIGDSKADLKHLF